MKNKLILLIVDVFLLFLATSCKKDLNIDGSANYEFSLNEGQKNWSKRLLIQRPISNLPNSKYDEYCEATTGYLCSFGDTITVYATQYTANPITRIFLSKNGGVSWTIGATERGLILSAIKIGRQAYAIKSNNSNIEFGVGIQYGSAWTWSPILGHPSSIAAYNKDTIYVYGNDGFRASFDAGNTWIMMSKVKVDDVECLDSNKLIGVVDGDIKSSIDNGKTWQLVSNFDKNAKSIYRASNGDLFAGTENGALYKSKDNGDSWEDKFILTNIYPKAPEFVTNDIIMVDACNGFAVLNSETAINCGDGFRAMYSCILRTNDRGETWSVNYRTQFINYLQLTTLKGPNVIALGKQKRDNILNGTYITLTTTLGN